MNQFDQAVQDLIDTFSPEAIRGASELGRQEVEAARLAWTRAGTEDARERYQQAAGAHCIAVQACRRLDARGQASQA